MFGSSRSRVLIWKCSPVGSKVTTNFALIPIPKRGTKVPKDTLMFIGNQHMLSQVLLKWSKRAHGDAKGKGKGKRNKSSWRGDKPHNNALRLFISD